MKKTFALFAVMLLALSLGGSGGAVAKESPRQFEFHAGDVFLNGLGFPLKNVTRASSNGDTVEVIATGELRVNGKKAEGTGSFAHKNAAGATLAIGSFTAERLQSFTDFGTQAGFPATFHSGTARILVHVVGHPTSDLTKTVQFDAVLRIDCDLSDTRPEFADGITLKILNGPFAGVVFDQKDPAAHGVTVFVAEDENDSDED
jgi:hypothetical protein